MAQESFLSQDEADALMAMATGQSEQKEEEVQLPNGVRRYDLGRPDRVVRKRMQTMELINERFSRRLRPMIFNLMRRTPDITTGPIVIQKYQDFERNLPVPSNLNIVKLSPLHGQALFSFDPKFVFITIDNMFGGSGTNLTRIEGRDFTAIENQIIRRLLGITLDAYVSSWDEIFPIDYTVLRSEVHTRFANITDSNEAVVVTPVRIEFGAVGGTLHIALPYSMIEPIRDLLTRSYQEAGEKSNDTRWSTELTNQVKLANLDVVANFAEIETTVAELLKLEKGSVLPLKKLPESVTALVRNVPVLRCGYGTNGDKYALSVQEHLHANNFEFLSGKH